MANAPAEDIDTGAAPPKPNPAVARAAAKKAAEVAGEQATTVELVHGSYLGQGYNHDNPAQPGDTLKVSAAAAARMIADGTAKAS